VTLNSKQKSQSAHRTLKRSIAVKDLPYSSYYYVVKYETKALDMSNAAPKNHPLAFAWIIHIPLSLLDHFYYPDFL